MNKVVKPFSALCVISIFVCVALAAGQTCAGGYPQCPDPNGPDGNGSNGKGGCNNPNVWSFGEIITMDFYICNGKDPKCARTGDNCNVMVRYRGYGRILTCEPAGWTRTCMTDPGTATPLNIKCENGQKCDPTGPTDTIPGDIIPGSSHTKLVIAPLELPDL